LARSKQTDGAEVWQVLQASAGQRDGEPVAAEEIAGQIEQLIVSAGLPEGLRLPSERGTVPDWLRPSEAADLAALHEPILAAVRDRDEEAGRIAVVRHHHVMAQHLAASQA
jgi:DNA-binding FadR family transcriptional regulator